MIGDKSIFFRIVDNWQFATFLVAKRGLHQVDCWNTDERDLAGKFVAKNSERSSSWSRHLRQFYDCCGSLWKLFIRIAQTTNGNFQKVQVEKERSVINTSVVELKLTTSCGRLSKPSYHSLRTRFGRFMASTLKYPTEKIIVRRKQTEGEGD